MPDHLKNVETKSRDFLEGGHGGSPEPAAGTPGGVGNKRVPQVFMKPGDVVEIEVDAIGILRNGIRDEA